MAIVKNNSSWYVNAVAKLMPSMINKKLFVSTPKVFIYYCNFYGSAVSLIRNTYCVGDFMPLEIAIQIAVSILSPVNIQTLTPAFLTFSSV